MAGSLRGGPSSARVPAARCRDRVRLLGGEEVPEPDRVVQDGQLHGPVEDQAAARRAAAVDAEDELVQVALQSTSSTRPW